MQGDAQVVAIYKQPNSAAELWGRVHDEAYAHFRQLITFSF